MKIDYKNVKQIKNQEIIWREASTANTEQNNSFIQKPDISWSGLGSALAVTSAVASTMLAAAASN